MVGQAHVEGLETEVDKGARMVPEARALERTLWAPGPEQALERTLWAPGPERALEWTL